jgi:hypothetical protein
MEVFERPALVFSFNDEATRPALAGVFSAIVIDKDPRQC